MAVWEIAMLGIFGFVLLVCVTALFMLLGEI